MSLEESPENERHRRRLAMQSARFVAEGHRACYVVPAPGEMRQREDRRARRDARRAQIARQNEAVFDWLRRKNFEDQSHHIGGPRAAPPTSELTESFDWKWVDRRIDARLREERAYFERRMAEMDAAIVDQARATNEVMAGIVRAVENVARSAAQGAKSSGDLATLTGAIQKLSETMSREARDNQRMLMRAIRRGRASQMNDRGANEPSAETARIH
jgi:hypothetical protein